MDEGMITLVCGIINCVADLLVTVLPIPVVMKLKMPMRQRVGVVCLLSLGFIVTIAGVVRTYYIWKSLVDSYDQTWFAYPLWIAAAVEIDLSVVSAVFLFLYLESVRSDKCANQYSVARSARVHQHCGRCLERQKC